MNAALQRRIVVRGVNWLGDAVMTLPALTRLREACPNAHITLLTHSKLRDLWDCFPALDETLVFEPGESVWSVAGKLRAGNFSAGLALPNSPRSALELWLAGIPERAGIAHLWRNWLLTRAVKPRPHNFPMRKPSASEINRVIREKSAADRSPPPPEAHHIHNYLHLVAAAFGASAEPVAPQLTVPDKWIAEFTSKFKLNSGSQGPPFWMGLNPGAEYGPAKRWPEERFIQAAVEIQKRMNCGWLIFGVKSESALADGIAAGIKAAAPNSPVVNLAGATTLRELCAGLKFCRVVLSNDSGPMHVAAAVGTPVVVPYGSTSPELTGPGLPGDPAHRLLKSTVPCSPCFLRECPIDFRCMKQITVATVVEAATAIAH